MIIYDSVYIDEIYLHGMYYFVLPGEREIIGRVPHGNTEYQEVDRKNETVPILIFKSAALFAYHLWSGLTRCSNVR